MNNELLEEKAQLYALGLLPEADREGFEAQIHEDRATQALVHGYQELVELDASSDEEHTPSFQVYAGIMDQIDESREEERNAGLSTHSAKLVPFVTWGGWAVAACVAAVFGLGLIGPGGGGTSQSDIVVNKI